MNPILLMKKPSRELQSWAVFEQVPLNPAPGGVQKVRSRVNREGTFDAVREWRARAGQVLAELGVFDSASSRDCRDFTWHMAHWKFPPGGLSVADGDARHENPDPAILEALADVELMPNDLRWALCHPEVIGIEDPNYPPPPHPMAHAWVAMYRRHPGRFIEIMIKHRMDIHKRGRDDVPYIRREKKGIEMLHRMMDELVEEEWLE